MVKRKESEKELSRVFYKKSFTTYSKTCSTLSHYKNSKDKRKHSAHKDFYSEGGKLKRDLSIETDLCRARRKCRKLLKLSDIDVKSLLTSKPPKSNKSRYSSFTDIGPISETQDYIASGDSGNISFTEFGPRFFVNKEDLVCDNLNGLVKNWIQKILEDNELKNMIQNLFDNAPRSTKSKKAKISSSCMTYVLEKNASNNKSSSSSYRHGSFSNNRSSLNEESSHILHSYNTIPVLCKTVRLISTLSVPRNKHKHLKHKKKTKTKKFKVRTGYRKKLLITLIQPNKCITDSESNIKLLRVSTKSWMKQCSNVDKMQYRQDFMQKNSYTSCHSSKNNLPTKSKSKNCHKREIKCKNKIKPSESLLNNIYIEKSNDDLNIAVHTYQTYNGQPLCNVKQSPLPMDHCDVLVSADYRTQNYLENENIKTKIPKYICKEIIDSNIKFEDIQHKKFLNVCDSPNRTQKTNDLLEHIKTIMEYIKKYNTENRVNLDIQVNILSKIDKSIRACSKESLLDFKTSNTIVYNIDNERSDPELHDVKTLDQPKIIPILDGAASQVKHLFNISTATSITKDIQQMAIKDQASMTNELGIKEELREMKQTLKEMSLLVRQCFKHQIIRGENTRKTIDTKVNTSSHFQNVCAQHLCQVCERNISDFVAKNDNLDRKCKNYENIKSLGNRVKLSHNQRTTFNQDTESSSNRYPQTKSSDYYDEIFKNLCQKCKDAVKKCSGYNEQLEKKMQSNDPCPICKKSIIREPNTRRKDIVNNYSDLIEVLAKLTCASCKDAISRISRLAQLKCPQEVDSSEHHFAVCPNCKKMYSQIINQDNKKITEMPQKSSISSEEKESDPKKSPATVTEDTTTVKGSKEEKNKNISQLKRIKTKQTKSIQCECLPPHNRENICLGPCFKDELTGFPSSDQKPLTKDAVLDRPSFEPCCDYSICKCPSAIPKFEDRLPQCSCCDKEICKQSQCNTCDCNKPQHHKFQETSKSFKECRAVFKKLPSTGFQITKSTKMYGSCGLKLSKDGRQRFINPVHNLASYGIIESESIIGITDMTSSGRGLTEGTGTGIGLTCSLPQPRSLYNVSEVNLSMEKPFLEYTLNLNSSKSSTNNNSCDRGTVCSKNLEYSNDRVINFGNEIGIYHDIHLVSKSNDKRTCVVNMEPDAPLTHENKLQIPRLGILTRTYYKVWFIVLMMLIGYLIYCGATGEFKKIYKALFSKETPFVPQTKTTSLLPLDISLSDLGF